MRENELGWILRALGCIFVAYKIVSAVLWLSEIAEDSQSLSVGIVSGFCIAVISFGLIWISTDLE